MANFIPQQWTLGQLIDSLEQVRNPEAFVIFDFGQHAPVGWDSYRGYYNHLAAAYSEEGKELKVEGWLEETRACLNVAFEGYKGGEYFMSRDTPLWVANYGETTDTYICGIDASNNQSDLYCIVINTWKVNDW